MKLPEVLLVLAGATVLTACSEEKRDAAACPGAGRHVVAGGTAACVFQRSDAIIENGFLCPEEMPFRHDFEDAGGRPLVICSEAEEVDLEEVRDAAAEAEEAPDDDDLPDDMAPPPPPPPPPPSAGPDDDGRDPNPPDDAPLEPPPFKEEGGRCAPAAESCEAGWPECFICALGLHCVPDGDGDEYGTCAAPGDGAVGEPCEAGDAGACGEGLACYEPAEGEAPYCSAVCTYTNYECQWGYSCPDIGQVCEPASPEREFPAGGCRPGADACPEGQGCQASVGRDTYDGFACAPAGDGGPFSACDAPGDCAAGLACAIHNGWQGSAEPRFMLFDLVWTGDEPHPLLGRSPARCMPLCGPGLPECGAGQLCARLQTPMALWPVSGRDAFFSFLGVCNDVGG